MRLNRRRFLTLLASAGGLGAASLLSACGTATAQGAPAAPAQSAGPQNVLVIVLDTVRYDRLTGPAAGSRTPNLGLIRASGVSFANAWATSSWSLPSQASILTGRYPHQHGADWPGFELDPKCPTLAEVFARRGYATGAFSGNAAWVTPEYLGRGFLRFEVYQLEDLLRRTMHGRVVNRFLQEVGYHDAGRGKKAATLNGQFLRFLDDYARRPFFAYLCYMDVNQTFHDRRFNTYPGRLAPEREVIAAYDSGLEELDAQIGALFTELARRGILESTLVIVTSDHGESFGAAVVDDHDPSGHGTSLYPEQLRVPLIVSFPGRIPSGHSVTQTVSLRAIPATVGALLGLEDRAFEGQPLPVAEQPKRGSLRDEAVVLATLRYDDRRLQAAISDRWQYITDLAGGQEQQELFDLRADPLATNNLVSSHLAVDLMRERLHDLLSTGEL